MSFTNFDVVSFLRALDVLPAGCPRPCLLSGFAALSGVSGGVLVSTAGPRAGGLVLPVGGAGVLGARLDRRYLRVRAVQDALGGLDFERVRPGAALDDFVFEQTDFSWYKKISVEDFGLFDVGLEDYDDGFYVGSFGMDRERIGAVIHAAYRRIGGFYYLNRERYLYDPLLMAVMRTLHTSLAFRPLVTGGELWAEFVGVVECFAANNMDVKIFAPALQDFGAVFCDLLGLLDGSAVIHGDGMITALVVGLSAEVVLAGAGGVPVLKGTFYPRNKAYTMCLA
jgi:hypothetical protein